MMTIDWVLDNVEGWLSRADAYLLAKYAALVSPPNCIVEIGSYRGRSSCVLGLAFSGMVYCVDPHQPSVGDSYPFNEHDFLEWTRNIELTGLSHRVSSICLPSDAVSWEPHPYGWNEIGLLFIDGRHSYEGVKEDIELWVPRAIDGGYVAFHDVNAPQIAQAITECKQLKIIERAEITAVYEVV